MNNALRHFRNCWYYYFFGLTVLFTLYMDAYMARTLLDGDASDLLYRAYTIAGHNDFFTTNYFSTTELRLFDVSFLFAPLFKIFSSWTLVRFCGTVLMQAFYVLSFLYMTKQVSISKSARWFCAALLLMPFSTAYARIILYHLYYIVYMTYFFLLFGLFLRLLNTKEGQRRTSILPFGAMALLWVVVGMNGMRHMMILLAPLFALTSIHILLLLNHYTFQKGKMVGDGPLREKPPIRLLQLLLFSGVFFFIGFLLNQKVLLPWFGVQNTSETSFAPVGGADRFAFIFNSFWNTIGMHISSVSVMSASGIAFVLALLSFGYLIWVSFRDGFQERAPKKDFSRTVLYGFFLASFLLTTITFVFDTESRWYVLYYVPVVVTAFPVLALEIDRLKESCLSCTKRIFIYLTCFAFLFQGVYTASFLLRKDTKWDIWSGLSLENVWVVECIRDCVEFMHDHGYTHGMAQYWYANVMVEYSDATVVVAPYDAIIPGEPVSVMHWGTSRSAFNPETLPEKIIVFMEEKDMESFQQTYPESVKVHTGVFCVGMEVDADSILP